MINKTVNVDFNKYKLVCITVTVLAMEVDPLYTSDRLIHLINELYNTNYRPVHGVSLLHGPVYAIKHMIISECVYVIRENGGMAFRIACPHSKSEGAPAIPNPRLIYCLIGVKR